jgi:TonB family protein
MAPCQLVQTVVSGDRFKNWTIARVSAKMVHHSYMRSSMPRVLSCVVRRLQIVSIATLSALAAGLASLSPGLAADESEALKQVRLGLSLQSKGDLLNAAIAFNKARELAPTDVITQNALISGWESAIKVIPTDPDFHIGYGQALQLKGDLEQARGEYQQAIVLSAGKQNAVAERLLSILPAAKDKATVNNSVNLGMSLQASKNYPGAIKAYMNALKDVAPSDKKTQASIFAHLGEVLEAQLDYIRAVKSFKKALSFDPTNSVAAQGLKYSEDKLAWVTALEKRLLVPRMNQLLASGIGAPPDADCLAQLARDYEALNQVGFCGEELLCDLRNLLRYEIISYKFAHPDFKIRRPASELANDQSEGARLASALQILDRKDWCSAVIDEVDKGITSAYCTAPTGIQLPFDSLQGRSWRLMMLGSVFDCLNEPASAQMSAELAMLTWPGAIDQFKRNYQEEHVQAWIQRLKPSTATSSAGAAASSSTNTDANKTKETKPVDCDFGPFMKVALKSIKVNWHPPRKGSSAHVIVQSTVSAAGRISNVKLFKSSGDDDADKAAMIAASTAILPPLPPGAPPSVDIQWHYDYTVNQALPTIEISAVSPAEAIADNDHLVKAYESLLTAEVLKRWSHPPMRDSLRATLNMGISSSGTVTSAKLESSSVGGYPDSHEFEKTCLDLCRGIISVQPPPYASRSDVEYQIDFSYEGTPSLEGRIDKLEAEFLLLQPFPPGMSLATLKALSVNQAERDKVDQYIEFTKGKDLYLSAYGGDFAAEWISRNASSEDVRFRILNAFSLAKRHVYAAALLQLKQGCPLSDRTVKTLMCITKFRTGDEAGSKDLLQELDSSAPPKASTDPHPIQVSHSGTVANNSSNKQRQTQVEILKAGDEDPYRSDLVKRIRRAWFPPKGHESDTVTVVFKVHPDGQMTNLRIVTSSGLAISDAAAIKAVENAAPFRPFPAGDSADIDFQFIFDFNALNDGGRGLLGN